MADERDPEFDELAQAGRTGFARELLDFLIDHKKWWLAPIVIAVVLLGLIVLLGGSAAAPFIYTLF